MSLRRVADDFELRYGYRPWLVESFVDQSRHTGTCYQASNWIEVGQTRGRGRQDSAHQHAETVKAIYLYPLEHNFRNWTGIELPVREALEMTEGIGGDQWAENEFGGAQLGDERLRNRLVESARIQAEKPGDAFSGAAQGSWPLVKGYYRMIDKPDDSAITMSAILAPHRERTVQRMMAHKAVDYTCTPPWWSRPMGFHWVCWVPNVKHQRVRKKGKTRRRHLPAKNPSKRERTSAG